MTGPPAEVAAVRTAVSRALTGIGCVPGTPVLVACSGGADSTALAAAVAHLARDGWPAHGAVVDHGLQDGSAARAAETASVLERLGVPTRVLTVEVVGPGGVEAAARRVRYAALRSARPSPESPVLLGHTLDDQAETVLLGLGRGSGARSLAGMATWTPPWLRPLLAVRRATTRAACAAQGLPVWDDPHNTDPRFTRVRLRHEVLPLLEDVLAGGVAEALARTAAHLAEDDAALDEVAVRVLTEAMVPEVPEVGGVEVPAVTEVPEVAGLEGSGLEGSAVEGSAVEGSAVEARLSVAVLAGHPAGVRRRVLRRWLLAGGVPELTDAHLRAADDLIGRWRGQGATALPGGRELARSNGRLLLRPSTWPHQSSARRPRPALRPDPTG